MNRKERGNLFLVDGTAAIFRAFFGVRPLTTRAGFPTNAVFGFRALIRRLLREHEPEYLGVAFDLPAPTFRKRIDARYKANRPPEPPEELVLQIPKVKELCGAMRIPIFEHEGFEADDILGTLARQAAGRGLAVFLVSSDKDLLQLIDDRVRVLHPVRNRLLDRAGVEEYFGVRPDQVVDVLALWGDSSDNVPGVPGIGEKGAKELIRRFGNLEECFRRASEVTRRKYREGLQNHRGDAELSRSLVTIRTDVPVDLDLDALRVSPHDSDRLQRLFEELEFDRGEFEDETGFSES